MTESSRYATTPPDGIAYPWNTGPCGQGSEDCAWCGRAIYKPALPCSVAPIAGLEQIATSAGLGDRCKYEVSTRSLANADA